MEVPLIIFIFIAAEAGNFCLPTVDTDENEKTASLKTQLWEGKRYGTR